MSDVKKLNDQELETTLAFHREVESITKDIKLIEETIKRCEVEKDLFNARVALKLNEIGQHKTTLSDHKLKLTKKLEKCNEHRKAIASKYKLEAQWGFDPLTGELK